MPPEPQRPQPAAPLLVAQRQLGNAIVARMIEPGQVGEPPPQRVVVHELTVVNPSLYVHMEDMGGDEPRLLVDDSIEQVAEFDGQMYVQIAQMCSIMSVYWMQDRALRRLRDLDVELIRQTAMIVYANQTPDAQVEFARQMLDLVEVAPAAVQQLDVAGEEIRRVLLFSPIHVSAALVGGGRIVYFDPETGDEAQVTADEFALYTAQAERALLG